MCDNSHFSGQPFEVNAVRLQTTADGALDAARVLAVASAITAWSGSQEDRDAFAFLLQRAVDYLQSLEESAVQKWTELD